MKKVWPLILTVLMTAPSPAGSRIDVGAECAVVATEHRLPVRVRTEGRPQRARWQDVDRLLTQLRESLQGRSCEWRFDEVFRARRDEIFFPVTNNLLRTVPEDSLVGLAVYDTSGELLGHFENRVTYERSGGLQVQRSYTIHYFQFKTPDGRLESTGSRLLLGDFLVNWEDLRSRVAISTLSP